MGFYCKSMGLVFRYVPESNVRQRNQVEYTSFFFCNLCTIVFQTRLTSVTFATPNKKILPTPALFKTVFAWVNWLLHRFYNQYIQGIKLDHHFLTRLYDASTLASSHHNHRQAHTFDVKKSDSVFIRPIGPKTPHDATVASPLEWLISKHSMCIGGSESPKQFLQRSVLRLKMVNVCRINRACNPCSAFTSPIRAIRGTLTFEPLFKHFIFFWVGFQKYLSPHASLSLVHD